MLAAQLAEARARAERLAKRPKVSFEEWNDPLISGIGWVSELVEIAGGVYENIPRQTGPSSRNVSRPVDRKPVPETVIAN
jgi:iron complex transport system substrate-binding protein